MTQKLRRKMRFVKYCAKVIEEIYILFLALVFFFICPFLKASGKGKEKDTKPDS